jgi:hypothetical protein
LKSQWKLSFSGGNFHFSVKTFLGGNFYGGNYFGGGCSKNEITGNYSMKKDLKNHF